MLAPKGSEKLCYLRHNQITLPKPFRGCCLVLKTIHGILHVHQKGKKIKIKMMLMLFFITTIAHKMT
jgi:hypothetical protein